jgi:hypothetical protein
MKKIIKIRIFKKSDVLNFSWSKLIKNKLDTMCGRKIHMMGGMHMMDSNDADDE